MRWMKRQNLLFLQQVKLAAVVDRYLIDKSDMQQQQWKRFVKDLTVVVIVEQHDKITLAVTPALHLRRYSHGAFDWRSSASVWKS